MERLTEPTIGCFKYDIANFKHKVGEFADYDAFFAYNMAVKRLGEYESLNLTPSEITAELAELAKYREAEKEGRLVMLPCTAQGLINWMEEAETPTGDEAETYTTGYKNGYNNGRASLIRFILQIPSGEKTATYELKGKV